MTPAGAVGRARHAATFSASERTPDSAMLACNATQATSSGANAVSSESHEAGSATVLGSRSRSPSGRPHPAAPNAVPDGHVVPHARPPRSAEERTDAAKPRDRRPRSLDNGCRWGSDSKAGGERQVLLDHQDTVYSTDESLTAREALALLTEKENRARARVARAVSAMEQVHATPEKQGGRTPITDETRIFVWRRDEGRCVRCGSSANLEFDHVIPVSMGGSNTARNLQLLCEGCNRAKSGRLV